MTASAVSGFFGLDATAPPRRAVDEEVARSLDRVLKISTAVVVLGAVIAPFSMPDVLPMLVVHAAFLAVLAGSYLKLRAGHLRSAGALLAGGFWLVSTGAVFAFGGVHSPGLFVYLPVVATAALFWSRRAASLLAFASAIVVLLVAELEALGFLPHPFAPLPPERLWTVFTGSLLMTAVLLLTALRRLSDLGKDLERSRALVEDISLAQARVENERSVLEDRLRNVERLESVGRLAGGAAHDFNNLLAVILSSASVLAKDQPKGSLGADLVGEIDEAARRATELVRKFLMRSGRRAAAPVLVDLNTVVAGLTCILKRLAGPQTELVLGAHAEGATVRADPGELEQVILNLALNARDAMPRGGRLSIETMALASLDASNAAPGDPSYVALVVADEGVGMDAATATRIFEPFFTTKGSAGGTGVGLACVKRIVDDAGGRIRLQTSPGRGTRVEVLLPSAKAA